MDISRCEVAIRGLTKMFTHQKLNVCQQYLSHELPAFYNFDIFRPNSKVKRKSFLRVHLSLFNDC